MNERSTAPRKAAIYLRISQDREMDGLAIEYSLRWGPLIEGPGTSPSA